MATRGFFDLVPLVTWHSNCVRNIHEAVRGARHTEERTLRAPLSGTLLEGCRKPVLGVWEEP